MINSSKNIQSENSNSSFDTKNIRTVEENTCNRRGHRHIKIPNDNTKIRNKNGSIIVSKLTKILKINKINLFDIDECIWEGKIDMSKICNDAFDENIDIFKYTNNIMDNQIDLAMFTNSVSGKLDLRRFFSGGIIDLAKITDTSNRGKLDISKISEEGIINDQKLILSRFTNSNYSGRIDLINIPYCIKDNKIDISKIKNTVFDDRIDAFKYIINTPKNILNLGIFTENGCDDIDLHRFSCIFSRSNKLCIGMVTNNSKREQLNLFDLEYCLTDGKINISTITNTLTDNKIDLFTHTSNTQSGKIDFGLIADSTCSEIDIYKFDGLFDSENKLDLAKITDSTNNGKINLDKIRFDCWLSDKILISRFTDSSKNGKIDLYDLTYCIKKGKIDISKIQNSTIDDGIDLFTYTTNTSDGKIDFSIISDSSSNKIDIYRLDGIFNEFQQLDLGKITNSNNDGKICLDTTNYKCFFNKKLLLACFYDSCNYGELDLFTFTYCVFNGKIDISKVQNGLEDDRIDFFKYTSNLKDGKIDLGIFTDSTSSKIDLSKLCGIFNAKGCLDHEKITDSSNNGKLNLDKINSNYIINKNAIASKSIYGREPGEANSLMTQNSFNEDNTGSMEIEMEDPETDE